MTLNLFRSSKKQI